MSVNNNRSYHSRYYQDGQGSQTSSHSSSTRTRSSVRGGGGRVNAITVNLVVAIIA